MPKTPEFNVRILTGLPRHFFNAAALRVGNRFLFIGRTQDDRLHRFWLDGDFAPISAPTDLGIAQNIDPRLTHWHGRLWMSTRYYGDWERWRIELWPLTADGLIDQWARASEHIRFFGVRNWQDYPGGRENNWAPFVDGDELNFVHSFYPHRVLRVDREQKCAMLWEATGFRKFQWGEGLSEYRLNTPPLPLGDGTFLSTMHVKQLNTQLGGGGYFTGFYRFAASRPWKVLQMSPVAVLRPEHSVLDGNGNAPTRASLDLFPLSMHLEGPEIKLIGGSRQSCCVVITLRLAEVLDSLENVS